MTKYQSPIIALAGLLFCLAVSGCLNRSLPQTNYFSLMTLKQLEMAKPLATVRDIRIGVGPVTIPDSLKRAQIVTRSQGNRYHFSELNRWAGTLEKDIAVVVSHNLGVLLASEEVVAFPWPNTFQPNFRVVVDIEQLDGELGGAAELNARWFIVDEAADSLLETGQVAYRQALADSSHVALVEAESRLIAMLSNDIAAVIMRHSP
ncbi:MAG: hypothetical protein C0614_02575 [Desulfuromonas sp.]|nr:MAG: hypothetical protein C0614_02575 [Desulfuromonas sp.]